MTRLWRLGCAAQFNASQTQGLARQGLTKENAMAQHSHAGKPARISDLTNIPRLVSAYYLN